MGLQKLTPAVILKSACLRNTSILAVTPIELHSKGSANVSYKCGHSSIQSMWRLLYGNSTCRQCSPAVIPEDTFKSRIAKFNPNIEVVLFQNMKKAVIYRCLIDGHQWKAAARTRKLGCKLCSNRNLYVPYDEYFKCLPKTTICLTTEPEYYSKGRNGKSEYYCTTCSNLWSTRVGRRNKFACPACSRKLANMKKTHTHDYFVKRVAAKNPNLELLTEYTGALADVTAKCKCGYIWTTRATSLFGHSCPKCNIKRQYSTSSIAWLTRIASRLRLRIAHAGNTGEYTIPTTSFRADGFNKRRQIIFEFLGDYWHAKGRLDNSKYVKTIKKFSKLVSLGYTIVYIWESDFYAGKSFRVISKSSEHFELLASAECQKLAKNKITL